MTEGRGAPPDLWMGQRPEGSQAPRVCLGTPARGGLLAPLDPRARRVTVRTVCQGHPAAQGTQGTGARGDCPGSRAGRETAGRQASWERRARRGTVARRVLRARRVKWEPQDGRDHRAERELRDQPDHGARRVIQERPASPASRQPAWPVPEERRVTEASQDQKGLLAPRAMWEREVPVVTLV